MKDMTRRSAIFSLGMSLWSSTAWAQAAVEVRDLDVETARPPRRRPRPAPQPQRPVQVSLMPVGPSTIAIGQPIRFRMVSLSDGFGHLYVLSASGRTQVWLENARVRAGQPLRYPLQGKIVRASPPAGDEKLIFVATRGPIEGFTGRGTNVPFDLQYMHESLRASLQQKLGLLPRDDWGFAEIGIRVRD